MSAVASSLTSARWTVFARAVQSVVPVGITISTPTAVVKGSTAPVTVTVFGSDGLPSVGVSVQLVSSAPAIAAVVSSPQTTNASGVATFTVSGVEIGGCTLTASAAGLTVIGSASVSAATSVAVLQILEPLVVQAGSAISVQVHATGTNGLPISGVSVTLASGTTGVATVASSPQTTNGSGIATFTLNGIAAGNSTLTATAASGAVTDTGIATVTAVAPPQPAGAQGSAWGRWIRGM